MFYFNKPEAFEPHHEKTNILHMQKQKQLLRN